MKKILYTLLITIISLGAIAQKDLPFDKANFKDKKAEYKEAKKSLDEGDDYFTGYKSAGIPQYHQAIKPFEKAYDFNPNSAMLNLKLGICYLNGFHKHKSLDFFKKAYKLNNTCSKKIHFFIGRAYHLKYEFDKAILEYGYYKKTLNQKDEIEEIYIVNKRIAECESAKKLYSEPIRVWVDNLGKNVNSEHGDYAPLITADESKIFFTSRRLGTGEDIDPYADDYFEDVWYSEFVDGEWTPAQNMGKQFNTEQHEATAGLSPDGQTIYAYIGRYGQGDIYYSSIEEGEWTKLKSVGKNVNKKDSWEPSACVSFDGKKLYYVSNKEGGIGELDIYVSTWDEEKERWGEGENLGPVVNSKYDDRSVFIHPDGKTLYFSSRGHNSMGGYDIFYTVLEDGNWTEPKNIGYPVNTPDDDVNFVMSASGRIGYYSSFHEDGLGEKDIYKVTFLGPEKEPLLNNEDNLLASVAEPVKEKVIEAKVEVVRNDLAILKGVITDKKSGNPLAATIELIDNETNEIVTTISSDSKTGKYLVSLPAGKNYGIAVKAEGFLFHSENFNIPEASGYKQYVKNIPLMKVEVGSVIVLRNIFFDYNKATITPASKNELERLIKLMNENPTLKIELSGHTDSRGNADYNQKLSQRRAESVVKYLVDHGIASNRLEHKGYGKTQLQITDAQMEGMSKEEKEDAHQQNRRTEFKILSK